MADAVKEIALRKKRRGLGEEHKLQHDDLVVTPKSEVVLGRVRKSTFEPIITKPRTIEDLRAQLGPSRSWVDNDHCRSAHLLMRRELMRWMEKVPLRKRVSDEEAIAVVRKHDEGGAMTNRMVRALSLGILADAEVDHSVVRRAIDVVLQNLEILHWLFNKVTVRAGSTLRFDPPGPHVFYAYELVIEAGGTIVSNQAPVTFDCYHLEAQ